MLDKRTRSVISYFFRAYPRRTAALIGMLLLSGLAEGVGLVTLLPLLEIAVAENAESSSWLGRMVTGAFALVGLQPTLVALLGVIVVGMSAKAFFLWLGTRQVGFTVAQVATDLRLRLLKSLMEARWGYFASQPVGHLANAMGAEAIRASQTYRAACFVISGAIQGLVYLVVAFLVSWWVALLSLVAAVVVVFALSAFIRLSREAGEEQTELTRSLVGRLTDALRGIKPIKAMAREDKLWPLLARETQGLNEASRKQVLAVETLRLFQEPIMVVIIAIGLYVLLTIGNQALSTLFIMAFLFNRLMGRVHVVQADYQGIVGGESAFFAVRDSVLEAELQRERLGEGRQPPPLEEGIELSGVTFGYGDVPVVRDVNAYIPVGRFISLVGPSGAGKTTLVDLVMGLHQPQSGTIRIDGVPLSEIDLLAWRRMVGYVPQEMFLFHDTILKNVTLGSEQITREEAIEALKLAGAWDFISRLPGGIDSTIGEYGSKLSGGQRQRIAIARALAGKPKLLILDEVTTALDPVTEAKICETLRGLRDRATIIAISHQPAMVSVADQVYRVTEGRLMEAHEGELETSRALA